jgi:hypothetical protein
MTNITVAVGKTVECCGKLYTKEQVIEAAANGRSDWNKALVLLALDQQIISGAELKRHQRCLSESVLKEWRRIAEVRLIMSGKTLTPVLHGPADSLFQATA